MSKRTQRPGETLKEALRASFSLPAELDAAQPLVHINCKGEIEIENCDGILEYSADRIVFRMRKSLVTVMGENLVIASLNRHITQISGRIFRVDFSEV